MSLTSYEFLGVLIPNSHFQQEIDAITFI